MVRCDRSADHNILCSPLTKIQDELLVRGSVSEASRFARFIKSKADASPTRLRVLASASLKSCVLLQECERYVSGRSIALFRDNQLCFAGPLLLCFVIGLVVFRPDKESDEISILFD